MISDLIDRIYECSFAPERWTGVLDELSGLAGAEGGVLFTARAHVSRWTASDKIRSHVERFFAEQWDARCTRGGRLFSARYPGFLIDSDIYTPAELQTDINYTRFLKPCGLGHTAATAISLPTGDTGIICLERATERGPVERRALKQLDALRPHLARSAFMATRLQLDRARIASETFALIGLPALVLDELGRVVSANDPAKTLDKFIRWRAFDHVALVDDSANMLLRRAIETLDIDLCPAPRSFAMKGGEDRPAMVANLVPIRGGARDIFVNCAAVLVLTAVGASSAPAVDLVQSLFDLTPAEARVARSLVQGRTVDEIAEGQSISRNTVRTHLRGVLGKTGCARQAEVVALLSGIMPVPQSSD